MKSRRTPCILFTNTQFYQIFISGFWIFPMFPYAHTKSISDVSVKFSAKLFHTSYLKVVNPPSYKLIEFLHLIAVADSPATTGEFFHSFLELRY